MNEISFKDFNKSLLNNSSNIGNGGGGGSSTNLHLNNNLKAVDGNNTRKLIEVKQQHHHNESASAESKSLLTKQLSNSNANNSINKSKQQANEISKVPFYPPGVNHSTKSIKKVAAENNLIPYDNWQDTLYSTWTPLSDENTNKKVYIFIHFS